MCIGTDGVSIAYVLYGLEYINTQHFTDVAWFERFVLAGLGDQPIRMFMMRYE